MDQHDRGTPCGSAEQRKMPALVDAQAPRRRQLWGACMFRKMSKASA
jgi:hypothetical protein